MKKSSGKIILIVQKNGILLSCSIFKGYHMHHVKSTVPKFFTIMSRKMINEVKNVLSMFQQFDFVFWFWGVFLWVGWLRCRESNRHENKAPIYSLKQLKCLGLEHSLDLPCMWRESNYFSHHHGFPRSILALSWSQELGIKFRHPNVGCEHLK